MSRESLEWLNVMTLIGDTEVKVPDRAYESWTNKSGQAWHYREAMQGDEPNHYPAEIPVADIRRRLFGWTPKAISPMVAEYMDLGANGFETVRIVDSERQMIVRPRGALSDDDPGAILGTFKSGYKIHEYDEWLIRNVEAILDDGLHVSSAGLLKNGAQAWVAVTIPEPITTPEGVEFWPILLGSTSLDGSLGTGYDATAHLPVCDNTLAIGRRGDRKARLKHTSNSLNKIGEVREKLGLRFKDSGEATEAASIIASEFCEQVAEQTNTTVSDDQWSQFLDAHDLTTLLDAKGNAKEKASKTHAMNRRAELEQLYRHDARCAPWSGTAFGVLQTVNTHRHHVATVRGASRPQRNMDRAITGGISKLDTETLTVLDKVLSAV